MCFEQVQETSTVLNITISHGFCGENQDCFIDYDLMGYCTIKTEPSPIILYPGEACSDELDDRHCYFGPRQCDNSTYVCRGWDVGHGCLKSGDCNAGLFCFRGKCAPTLGKNLWSKIQRSGACAAWTKTAGMTSFVIMKTRSMIPMGLAFGLMGSRLVKLQCTHSITSIGTGIESFLPIPYNPNRDLSDAYLLCESYYANDFGICALGYQVQNKGKSCINSDDCLNSFNERSECKCKMDASSLPDKVCTIGTED
jgi:hypothetical protein